MRDYYRMPLYTPGYGYNSMHVPYRAGMQYQTVQQPIPAQQQPRRVIRGFAPYTYPLNYRDALELIRDAVRGEAEDRAFYEYLIENAPDEKAKEIIREYVMMKSITFSVRPGILCTDRSDNSGTG